MTEDELKDLVRDLWDLLAVPPKRDDYSQSRRWVDLMTIRDRVRVALGRT